MNTPARPPAGRPARGPVVARWLLALAWLILAATRTSAADTLDVTHAILSGDAHGQHLFFLDIDAAPANANGTLSRDVLPDLLHPNEKGDEIWATRREPTLLQPLARP